jgi:hypothetical protein
MRRLGQRQDLDLETVLDYRESMSVERAADIRTLRKLFERILGSMSESYRSTIPLLFGLNASGIAMTASETARVLKLSETRMHCLRCLFISRVFSRYGEELRAFMDGELG